MLLDLCGFIRKAAELANTLEGGIGIDIETTGLSPHRGDNAFLLGFTDTDGQKFSVDLTDPRIVEPLELLLSNPGLQYAAHNASFEKHFFRAQFGLEIRGRVWDTLVNARIARNNYLSYSLQSCAERMGESKYEPMLIWLKQRGNKGRYDEAPRDLIVPYVEQDAWLSWKLCQNQLEIFRHWDTGVHPIRSVVALESRVSRPLFDMECRGMLIDVDYCKEALEYEQNEKLSAAQEFEQSTGRPFVDSRKTLQPVFDTHGIRYGQTALGHASFTEENLKRDRGHPLVAALLRHRTAVKRASAYWGNLLELQVDGVIHPSIHSNRAQTGRMSISDPSLQNFPTDEDDHPWPLRRAFMARPGGVIVSMDYAQMELRLMCDEAGDTGMIEAFQQGRDFHQETADAAGVPRSLAKNGRFAMLYGAGVKKVAETLGIEESLARDICASIEASSPQVSSYSRGLVRYAERSPYGFDFLGRRFYFDSGFAYKYPNYRIQGGCAEILKIAILDVANFLKKHASPETYLLVPIHDELLFQFAESDLHLLPQVKQLMVNAHRSKKSLAMDVSVYQGQNFHDLTEVRL